MNNLLKIKLKFARESKQGGGAPRNLTCDRELNVEKVVNLIDDLNNVKSYYKNNKLLIKGCLIDIHYDDVIPKSSRVQEILKGDLKTDQSIVGARFSDDQYGEEKHIITHYVNFSTIELTIKKLNIIIKILNKFYEGKANKNNFNIDKKHNNSIKYNNAEYSDLAIRDMIVDCSVINKFDIPQTSYTEIADNLLITFYKTELKVSEVFDKIYGDSSYRYYSYGENTLLVDKETFKHLQQEVPYLISMVASDISELKPFDKNQEAQLNNIEIPAPKNEPIVGVIDTLFNQSVYFKDWVDYHEELTEYEKNNINEDDYYHGTEVTSIIVDGPTLNPDLDDHCGRFRVRHFGVCGYRISPSLLIKKISRIVDNNPDIHVWNLSLGTSEEVSRNFMSYESSVLDEIQATKNVIFVISGTNDNYPENGKLLRVGSPADSINSIVVNAVKRNNLPCSYSRSGPILSFFQKPDVSYYGGDVNEKISVCSPIGVVKEMGTSFAAPWISRKLCYLIDIMGLPREVAKALIIDAAAGWEYKQDTYKNQKLIGYGVVPININDILTCPNSEIKFILYETSRTYKTVNYAIPIPKDASGKYPFIARSTLCYFPKCRREQGVDYTDRELSLTFGKINKNGLIEDVNENVQDTPAGFAKERRSRQEYRKWDNTKFISSIKKNNQAKKSFEDKFWGFCVASKERTAIPKKENLNFGAVITLHEIKNINRIEEFKHACMLRGYIVTEVQIDNQINIYESAQQDIKFE